METGDLDAWTPMYLMCLAGHWRGGDEDHILSSLELFCASS